MYTFKGNNRATSVIDNNQHFILHSTSVVILNENKSIVLNSGGWLSNTTKKVLNEVGCMLGFSVYQKAGKWFVEYKNEVLDFTDNMILN